MAWQSVLVGPLQDKVPGLYHLSEASMYFLIKIMFAYKSYWLGECMSLYVCVGGRGVARKYTLAL